jgi:hypothetical protein
MFLTDCSFNSTLLVDFDSTFLSDSGFEAIMFIDVVLGSCFFDASVFTLWLFGDNDIEDDDSCRFSR